MSPTRARKLCAEQRCGELVDRGRCPAHTRRAFAGRPSYRQRGYTAAWDRMAREMRERGEVCVWCREARATELDHVVPKARGGTNDRSNAAPSCGACNRKRAAQLAAETRRARRGGGDQKFPALESLVPLGSPSRDGACDEKGKVGEAR